MRSVLRKWRCRKSEVKTTQTTGSDWKEYLQYAQEVEQTLCHLETILHSSDDPEEIGAMAMRTACEFYRGDWTGFIEVDLDLGIWTPYWWYNDSVMDRTPIRMDEFERTDKLERWLEAMDSNHAIAVSNVDKIEEMYPEEYDLYKRLNVHSIIGVPVRPRPTGFLVVRNPKRYLNRSSMLQMLAYVVLSAVNEKKTLDAAKLIVSPDNIRSSNDVVINLMGTLEIYTSKGVLREADFKSPRVCRLLAYMVLHRKSTHPPREIVSALWPDTVDFDGQYNNLRGVLYRFRQGFSCISDLQLIESTPNGYRLNPNVRVITDIQMFDNTLEVLQKSTPVPYRVELLKKAFGLYRGPVMESASSDQWLANTATHYNLRYRGVVNDLLKLMAESKDYSGVYDYATKSLDIDPENLTAHYWLIYALYYTGAVEMAKAEVQRAKIILDEEEYQALIHRLKRLKGRSPFDFLGSRLFSVL